MPTLKSSATGLRAAASLVLGLLVPAVDAAAQLRIDLTPFVGSYYALAALGRTTPGVLEERQENQPTVGGAILVRLTASLGVEGAFAFTPSGVNITGAANQGFDGTIIFGSARLRLSAARTNLYGLAGVGIVARSGDAWADPQFTSLTSVAGVLGVGTRAEVSPAVRIDVKLEVNLYSVDPDGSGTNYESQLQTDVLFGLGFPISLSSGR